MASMWRSRQDDAQTDGDDNNHTTGNDTPTRASRRSYEHHEPNERTRLLQHHPPPTAEGYLDPDDPAVSLPVLSLSSISLL
jgi:hypothetical protein